VIRLCAGKYIAIFFSGLLSFYADEEIVFLICIWRFRDDWFPGKINIKQSKRVSRYFALIQRAADFLNRYKGAAPLEFAVREFFRQHREMGSTDRKHFKHLVFSYYRILGNVAYPDAAEVLHYAALLNPQIAALSPVSMENTASIAEIRRLLQLDDSAYFPASACVSKQVYSDAFIQSHFTQPPVFIRVTPLGLMHLEKIFQREHIGYLKITETTWEVQGRFSLTEMPAYNEGYFEVQDYASQQTIAFMHPQPHSTWWDCCAGSGGKSLLLLEKNNNIRLVATDNRVSVLENYRRRLSRYCYSAWTTLPLDVGDASADLSQVPMCDGIIADVPCSGSGTWARNPSGLRFFDTDAIPGYAQQQRRIAGNAATKLLPGGTLIYITCSVYAAENEENAAGIAAELRLELERTQYLFFPGKGSDVLFIAVFKKPAD